MLEEELEFAKKEVLITPSSLCANTHLLASLESEVNLTFLRKKLPDDIKKYNVIIIGNENIKREDMADSDIELIIKYGIGIDNIDKNAAKDNEIIIANTPGVASESIAEYIIGAIYTLSKKFGQVNKKDSDFVKSIIFDDIADKKIGIIGLGSIGKAIARKAYLNGMKVIACNRTQYPVFFKKYNIDSCALNELLKKSDYVSVCIESNSQTQNLLNRKNLHLMSKNSYLINISRAEVVNQDALYVLLAENRIKGAVLDVYHENKGLEELDNVILTPHIASRTKNTTFKKIDMVIKTIREYICGQSITNKVNLSQEK